MTGGAILPVAIYNNKLYFLMGKENELERSAKGWADFGGGSEGNETPIQTALREGSEELCGFLGGQDRIRQLLDPSYHFKHKTYNVFIFRLHYDPNLPLYYNEQHAFLWNKIDNQLLQKSRCFEKEQIRWFTEEELTTMRSEFRPFYQEVVEDIVTNHMKNIYRFMEL